MMNIDVNNDKEYANIVNHIIYFKFLSAFLTRPVMHDKLFNNSLIYIIIDKIIYFFTKLIAIHKFTIRISHIIAPYILSQNPLKFKQF